MKFRIMNITLVKKENKSTLQIIRDINNYTSFEYMNLTTGFEVHCVNNFLRSLNTGLEIKFESFRQFNELIKNINKIINCNEYKSCF